MLVINLGAFAATYLLSLDVYSPTGFQQPPCLQFRHDGLDPNFQTPLYLAGYQVIMHRLDIHHHYHHTIVRYDKPCGARNIRSKTNCEPPFPVAELSAMTLFMYNSKVWPPFIA